MRLAARVLVIVVIAIAGAPAAISATTDTDPLHAPECQRALAALQAVEAAASAPSTHAERSDGNAAASGAVRGAARLDPQLAAARRDVARRCLAARTDPPPAGRLAEPPVAVPPVAGARAAVPPGTPSPAPVERIPAVQPPVAITSCDAGGCWTSDGARLQRLGPTLWSPRGACSVVGAVVHCP